MSEQRKFQLATDDVKKLNLLLPKGYRFVTQQEFKKKAMLKPKKKTIMGLPVTPQIVNEMNSRNLSQSLYQKPQTVTPIPPIPVTGRATKNTKFMGPPSYQSLPQSEYFNTKTINQGYDKIPLSLDYDISSQRKSQVLSTPVVFSKLKNHPQIMELDKVEPEMYSLSFRDIERKVNNEKDNYKVSELVSDVSKLCLKIYESYKRESNQYQNTVSIEKYLKSLTKVQKVETNLPPANIGLVRQPSTVAQIKKKPPMRVNDLNAAITIKEKRQLGQRIKKLPSQCLQQICYILFENLENKEYSFDLDTLHIKKIRQLQEYVNSCMDFSQSIKEYEEENKMSEDDDGQESSFIIEGDGEEGQIHNEDYQF